MNADLPRLKYLLEQYTSNVLTQNESSELMSLIKQSRYETDIKKFIEQEIAGGLTTGDYPQLSAQRAAILYKKIIGIEKKEPIKIIGLWRYVAAAVIIGIISLGYFLFSKSETHPITASIKKSNSHIINDALPGSKGAILTLSNGKQIVLDSAANGKLASQGTTVIMNTNGQVVYENKVNTPGEMLYNTMTTPRGRQFQLLLSDGTKVWLNSASSIYYPVTFSRNTRRVTITGEAYFEVAKNEQVPFIVKVNETEVKVMGTHFNVNAYNDEESVKTTLLEGSVKVSHGGSVTALVPGQQSKVYKTGSIELIKNADLDEAVAWKDGVFLFNKSDIQSVMRQIGRWYDLEIAYQGEISKDLFGGKLPMDAKVSQVLGALEQTQVHFKINGKKIIVMP